MSELEVHPSIEEMTTAAGQEPAASHDAWVRETVERRLLKKKSGKTTYRSLDEVAAEFGFDAR